MTITRDDVLERPAVYRSLCNDFNVLCIGRELGHDGNVNRLLYRCGNLADKIRILAHSHAVALGVWAGQVQLKAITVRRE